MKTFSFLALVEALAVLLSSWQKVSSDPKGLSAKWAYLAVEEVVDSLPPELSTLESLGVDLSTLLLAETGELGCGALGEVLVIRLGDLLWLLWLSSGSGSSFLGLGSRGLRSLALDLSVLLAFLLG